MTRRAGLDRAVVITAAADLADRDGLERLSLAALAEQLGVRTPSLYNHISGLEGVRRELALLGTRQLAATLGRAAVGKSADEAIGAMADAYRAFVKEHPGLYTASVRPAAPDDPELAAVEAELVDTVLRVLSGYGLRGKDAVHAVRALRSVVHGFASLEAAGGFGLPLDLNESFRKLICIFLAGISASYAPPAARGSLDQALPPATEYYR